jgi:hypothetical protein
LSGSTGIYLGYYGLFQTNGNNFKANVDNALGNEQGIYLGWERAFTDLIGMKMSLSYIFYPFADENLTGTKNPSVLEPLVSLMLTPWVDLSVDVSYFAGISGDALKDMSHVYIRPQIAKSLWFNDRVGMTLGAGIGFKIFTLVEDMEDNTVDVLFDWTVPIAVAGPFYIEPCIHLGWTNFKEEELVNAETGETVTFGTPGDEFMVYGSINVGADF